MRRMGDVTNNPFNNFGASQDDVEAGNTSVCVSDRSYIDERRFDGAMHRHVERAVRVQQVQGHEVAAAFMIAQHIPDHVRLRVLAGAAFRRKPLAR